MKRLTFGIIAAALALSMNALSQTARVQVIHNSADLAANTVDVYLDNTLLIDDFQFRTASPFIDAPAGVQFTVGIAPSNSSSSMDAIATFDYTLASGETYVLVAEGIISPSGYSPSTAFDIAVYGMGRETASMSGNTDVLVHHGSTDAPTVDVAEIGVGAGTIVDNASYGDFAGYLELATADYQLQIQDQTGMTAVATYDAPLATLGLTDAALVVVASGFLNPAMNSNGPAFGLFVALPTGGDLVELPTSSTADINSLDQGSVLIYPNPTSSQLKIEIEQGFMSEFQISDISGKLIKQEMINNQATVETDISSLPTGEYYITLMGNSQVKTFKFSKI
jgi:hypothetical protein